jgi:hypothetical protein
MAYYDPMQSLAVNLANAGYAPQNDAPFGGSMSGVLDPTFLSAIQTAFARDRLALGGLNDYGGQTAFDLIAQADPARASIDPLGYANELLAQSGVPGFSSVQEWQQANRALPGHNEGSSFGDFIGGSIEHLGDTASDLWSEPGFRALALTAGAGSMLGGPTGTAGAGGTAGVDIAAGAGGFPMPAAIPEIDPTFGGALSMTAPGVWETAAPAAIGGTLGGIAGGAASSLFPSIGDILKGAKDYLPSGNTAAALAPIIAAIAYAKNQGPFDTSRLTSTYDQFQPDALAYEFDQNTNAGRNALTSSLTNRGVMGSSFGNMDLTNFQTTRDLGRRSLVNQGLAVRGGLANNILEAQVKERQLKNQLYGTSLLALGNVFGGRNQPTAGV